MSTKIKILLIEDTKSLLELYKTRFLIEGFEVFTASNSKDVFEIAEKSSPDLFIVDIMLTDSDGLEVIKALKKKSETKDSAFIVLTAIELEDKKQEATSLGVDAFLVKSQITLEDIVSSATKVLKTKHRI